MSEPLLLALDQGTTSTRAILFDARGVAVAEAGRPLAQSYPHDGWVEHDAAAIHAASIEVMREAVERSGRRPEEIAALGITNQRETTVVWDRATGVPIHPAIVWQDRRTSEVCEGLRRAGHETEVTERTGLLLDPYFSATKIAWILDHVEGARARAEAGDLLAGTIDCWLAWKLTGGRVHATDATNASRTLLMELETQAWSDDLCRILSVPRRLLPEIRDNAGDYGEMDAAVLGRAIPIRGMVGDQQSAMMGQGTSRPGGLKATYGTGCFMLLNTGERRPRSTSRLLSTVAARVDGRATYALEGSIFMAGASIQWLGEELGIAGGPKAAEALAQKARRDHGVVAVPAFTGLGAPHWDAEARGAILGLTRDSGLPEIAAAMFDACALQSRDLIEAMRHDSPEVFAADPHFRIDGGMARSPWFAQRLADLTGIAVDRADYAEATALGAAMFAGLGAGVFASMAQAQEARPDAETVSPVLGAAERELAYAHWSQAVRQVRLHT